jgi:hypothetical protein
MMRRIILALVLLNSTVSADEVGNEDGVINAADPDDEVVTDEEVADDTYDLPLEPQDLVPPSLEEKVETRTVSAPLPNLTEEELTSQLMPDRFLCDSCHILVFNVSI